MILFSIIIPAYNVETYIVDSLSSVSRNNLEHTEVIVVDDGSTDTTFKKISDFFEHNDIPHYNIIHQENGGVSKARNAGIKVATGKYIVFCDGDDLCKPNMIDVISKHIDKEWDMLVWRYDITQSNVINVSQDEFNQEEMKNSQIFKSFLFGENRIRLGSFAITAECIQQYNLNFTVGCVLSQDVEFIFKCLANVKKICLINDILFTYVKHEGSVMYKYNLNRFEAPKMVKRLCEYVEQNTNLFQDEEVKDYLQNGFYIQHSMFAFDSCITYLQSNTISTFWKQYNERYPDSEKQIQTACSKMKRFPQALPKKRVTIFCISRKLYIRLFVFNHNIKRK